MSLNVEPAQSSQATTRGEHAGSDSHYQASVSAQLADPEWDAFLNRHPGGDYVQSSLWAQTKAIMGWHVVRLVIRRDERIVAGAQILARSFPLMGSLGYIPRGPVLAPEQESLQEGIIREVCQAAKKHNVQALVLQPPGSSEEMEAELKRAGFRPSNREVAPTYTLLLELAVGQDELLAQMNSGTRYNIRYSERKGIVVREGDEQDLANFYELARLTSERQGFMLASAEYYQQLWDVFAPSGHLRLFLAEYEGQLVSAQLAIPFGDVVTNKLTVWSGQHGNLKPNEGLLWGAIRWAKQNGYNYYDFGGLSRKVARPILLGKPIPEKMKGTVSSFKIGFGGQVAAFSGAYSYVSNSTLRWVDHKVLASLEDSSLTKRVVHRLRTR